MKVLKFGGSSVANADNIKKVASIVSETAAGERCAVVLSAMQGTTDDLIEAGRIAESGSRDYSAKLADIRQRHLQAVSRLITGASARARIDEFVSTTANEIEKLCEGVMLVRELSPRTLDRIVGFGELLSTTIFAETLAQNG